MLDIYIFQEKKNIISELYEQARVRSKLKLKKKKTFKKKKCEDIKNKKPTS